LGLDLDVYAVIFKRMLQVPKVVGFCFFTFCDYQNSQFGVAICRSTSKAITLVADPAFH